MRSSSSFNIIKKVRKGQFFILTSIAVVTVLFFISRWTGPSTQVDASSLVSSEELFTFDNIQQKTSSVVKNSYNCDDLNYNLEEYKNFLKDFSTEKNYKINFVYTIPSCSEGSGATVNFNLRVQSEKVDAQKDFSIVWP